MEEKEYFTKYIIIENQYTLKGCDRTQFEPVTASAALRFAEMYPHVFYVVGIRITNTANQTLPERTRDEIRPLPSTWTYKILIATEFFSP